MKNLFERVIPKQEELAEKSISDMEQNLEQAKKRIEMPFPREEELKTLQEELAELEDEHSRIPEWWSTHEKEKSEETILVDK